MDTTTYMASVHNGHYGVYGISISRICLEHWSFCNLIIFAKTSGVPIYNTCFQRNSACIRIRMFGMFIFGRWKMVFTSWSFLDEVKSGLVLFFLPQSVDDFIGTQTRSYLQDGQFA